ncbi:hypothetical protein [Kitasatospora viridis]|uniref:Lipoprotein n=1 Tax=Kitasatospora viridis TaxID=281105 RepID=A0A561S9Q5_9ACTN|nr:hypothetical protein [Kitasatospora viridis]TWF71599.1 hypothetical protein FHX73_19229 [Kitasatospora viridis]
MSLPSSRRPAVRTALALTAAVLACTASGCAAAPGPAAARRGSAAPITPLPPAPVAGTAAPTTPAGLAALRLPIEDYLLTPAQDAQLNHAVWVLAAACMKRQGFDFQTPPELAGQRSGGEAARRYGPADPAAAAVLGYHDTAAPAPQQPSGPPAPADLPAPERAALIGSPQGGPAGGCHGEAQRRLAGTDPLGSSQLAGQINSMSYGQATADPRVTAAFAAWSGCMKANGYAYATPVDAYDDPRWKSPAPGPVEIATALADIACKQRTDLIGTWYAVDAAYQQHQITVHQAQLDHDRAAEQHQLALAGQQPAG